MRTGPAFLVPYLPAGPERALAWAYVRDRLHRMYHWPIHEGWQGSKTASVNHLALQTAADVLVIHDADSFVQPDELHEAVRLVRDGAPWVVPHSVVYRLSRGATHSWLQGDQAMRLCRAAYQGPAGGGIVVVSRDAYMAVGGMDERFTEWGWEDQAFGRALHTLVGPYVRLDGQLIHLWHPPAVPSRKPSVASTKLWQEYRAATFCPRLMQAVVTGQEPAPWVALDEPRHFRSATPRQVVRYGLKSAHFRDHQLSTLDPDLADAMRCYEHVTEVSAPC